MTKSAQEVFFVEIKRPKEVRRIILESLREILENLRQFEKFKEARTKKMAKIAQLRKSMRDIGKQVNALRSLLPESKVIEQQQPGLEGRDSRPVKKQSRKKVQKKHNVSAERTHGSELEQLSSELAAIEERLKGL